MAIAGSMTTAYWVRLRIDGNGQPKLATERTTFSSDRCNSPADAVAIVRRGDVATVQGSDMAAFWQAWEGAN